MRHRDLHAAGQDLRVLEHLRHVVDRAARHAKLGQALRERGALRVDKEVDAKSAIQVIIHAVLINILNPKLSIFFFAFLPQFVSADEAHPLPRMLELSGVFMLMTFGVFAVYGLFAAVRDQIISRPRILTWMRRTFAAAFAALGAKLAFAER
jgi:threonine/homoserine/homoserine lactone efflux protein